MIYGYARCSTTEGKQDVERQKRELRSLGAEQIFFEYESGTKIHREELEKCFSSLRENDTIIATEVSRITRSVKQLCDIIDECKNKKVRLLIGSFVVDCRNGMDAMTEGMLKMMGLFAEIERNLTVERVKSGLKNAKAKGVRLGRPKLVLEKIPKKVVDFFPKYKSGELAKVDFARLCGISRPTLDKYIAMLTDM